MPHLFLQINKWLEGEHKVLVIAPSENHDSTSRSLTTLKAAGLEHEIVKTIVLDQVGRILLSC